MSLSWVSRGLEIHSAQYSCHARQANRRDVSFLMAPTPRQSKQSGFEFPSGKIRFRFSRFQPARHALGQGQYSLPLVLSRRPITEMMQKLVTICNELRFNQLQEKYPYEISRWSKATGGSGTSDYPEPEGFY